MSIFQVTWKQRWLAQEIRNTFYYQTTVGDPSTSEWGDIADEIRADLVIHHVPFATVDWNFYAIDYRKVDVAGLLSFEALPTLGTLVGTSTSDDLPTQVAILVSVKGVTVAPNRARTYLGGLGENVVTDSLVGTGFLASFETLIDLQSALNTAGTNPLTRVAARWNTAHTMVTAWNDISGQSSKTSLVPATQRRRRIGVGI